MIYKFQMPATFNIPISFLVVLSLAVLLISHRRLGARATVNMGFLLVGGACLSGLLFPWIESLAVLGMMGFIVILGLLIALIPARQFRYFRIWLRRIPSRVQNLVLLIYTLLLLVGGSEILARTFTNSDITFRVQPIVTVLLDGNEDYRNYHMVGDIYHVPDSDLGWVPRKGGPYTEQRMRGPVLEVPKPKDVFRIICYGDSNTEGAADERSWPEELNVALKDDRTDDGKSFEVANAGVAGYSTHQGLKRFLREVDVYQPDLIFISFGWNDFAKVESPDKNYRPSNKMALEIKRFLFQYQFFIVLLNLTVDPMHGKVPMESEFKGPPRLPRVSIPEYEENLAQFIESAKNRGIRPILLTRPHQKVDGYTNEGIKKWLIEARRYNAELVRFANRRGFEYIDIEWFFSKNHPNQFRDSCHFTPEGNRIMARLLRDYLLEIDKAVSSEG